MSKTCKYCNETFKQENSDADNSNEYCSVICELMVKIEGDFND